METKGPRVDMKKTSSWSLVLAMISSRNLTRTPALYTVEVSTTTPSSVRSTSCGSTRSSIIKRLMADPNNACFGCSNDALPTNGRTANEVECRRHRVWCGGHVLLPMGYDVFGLGVWQCYCCQMLRDMGKVQDILPALTTRQIRSNVYEACVRSSMLLCSETWGQ